MQSILTPKSYRSFPDLWGDSTKILLVDVEHVENPPLHEDDLPVARLTVRVRDVLASKPDWSGPVVNGQTLVVQQIGKSGVPLIGGIDILTAGRRYLVFLLSGPTGASPAPLAWMMTGPEGVYAADDQNHLRRLFRESALPATIDLASLVSQALDKPAQPPTGPAAPTTRH